MIALSDSEPKHNGRPLSNVVQCGTDRPRYRPLPEILEEVIKRLHLRTIPPPDYGPRHDLLLLAFVHGRWVHVRTRGQLFDLLTPCHWIGGTVLDDDGRLLTPVSRGVFWHAIISAAPRLEPALKLAGGGA